MIIKVAGKEAEPRPFKQKRGIALKNASHPNTSSVCSFVAATFPLRGRLRNDPVIPKKLRICFRSEHND